jgi:hypothetical protein
LALLRLLIQLGVPDFTNAISVSSRNSADASRSA